MSADAPQALFEGFEDHDYDAAFMDFVIAAESVQAKALGEWMVHRHFPRNVIDFGCGPGLYLLPYKESGAKVLGIDAATAGGGLLDPEEYLRADLRFPLIHPVDYGSFDLAICFETAEHLSPECADQLVETVCCASNFVLFTGATPGQGGTNHHNEQPHEYWLQKFERHGFVIHALQGEMQAMLAEFEPLRDREVSGWIIDNCFFLFKPTPEQRERMRNENR